MRELRQLQILVVDDNDGDTAILADLIAAQHHSVVVANSGEEGLQLAQAQQPDLILLDVIMPGMDGFAVCTQLRASPATAEVPIIMLTALDDRISRLRGIESGADEFLTKPFDRLELRLRIQTTANVNRYRKLLDEREQAIVALAQARDAFNAASRLKSEFLATVSHELRTPLSGIIGMSELLLTTTLDADQQEFAQTVHNSGTPLLAIVDEMLEYTKFTSGGQASLMLAFDPAGAIAAVVESMLPAAQAKGLDLTIEIDTGVPAAVRGDLTHLQKVLGKLLDNAIKFTPQGQVVVSAELAQATGDQLLLAIRVRDTGPGIAETQQRRLFQPFQQADGTHGRSYGGIGMGLAISKRLIEHMGGTIGMASAEGQGTTVWIQVPLRRAVSFDA